MIKFLLRKFTKVYDTYTKSVSECFAEPHLFFKFGKWGNDPCLPVWRHGVIINLDPKYKRTISTPPKGITGKWWSSYDWRPDIKEKLTRLHLGWIRPIFELPIWTAFHIFNHDVYSKIDEDDYISFEFPPQFTIVAFGLSWSWYLSSPKTSRDTYRSDVYWESIENFVFSNQYDIYKTIRNSTVRIVGGGPTRWEVQLKPEFLRVRGWYWEVLRELEARYPDRLWVDESEPDGFHHPIETQPE